MMKKPQPRKNRSWYLRFLPLLQLFAVLILLVIALVLFCAILWNAKKLKWFTIPLMVLHMTTLIAAAAWLWWRKEKIEQRALMGDELFFELYPFERWLHEKRQARKVKAVQKKAKESRHA